MLPSVMWTLYSTKSYSRLKKFDNELSWKGCSVIIVPMCQCSTNPGRKHNPQPLYTSTRFQLFFHKWCSFYYCFNTELFPDILHVVEKCAWDVLRLGSCMLLLFFFFNFDNDSLGMGSIVIAVTVTTSLYNINCLWVFDMHSKPAALKCKM